MAELSNQLAVVAAKVANDYRDAQEAARGGDIQLAGHDGEGTWRRILSEWLPGFPVKSRRYIVGPGGRSQEIDLVLLRPDYPTPLIEESTVLASGVVAAFECKLTLKRPHIAQAIALKAQLTKVAGDATSIEGALRGPIPLALLSHSADSFFQKPDFSGHLTDEYEFQSASIDRPSDELDALLVADRAFFSTMRMTLSPKTFDPLELLPSSAFTQHNSGKGLAGTPILQFLMWLQRRVSADGQSPLHSFSSEFGVFGADGHPKYWPMEIYPEHHRDVKQLLNAWNMPIAVD